jgi:CheY-like chemotaxis protein
MHFPLQVGLGGYVVEGLSMAGRQPRVLVADDSNAVHQLICAALAVDYAADVTHAYNGIECLNAPDNGVDLAFIDVHMPTMAVWTRFGQRALRGTRLLSL